MSDEQRRERYANPGDGDGSAAAQEGGRDHADIARMLRALNDDLRDDAPPPRGLRGEPAAPSGEMAARGPFLSAGPAGRLSGGMIGGRPSVLAVAVAVIAAAAIGLGSILFSGDGGKPSGEPPNLLVPSRTAAEQQTAVPPVAAAPAARPAAPSSLLTPGQTTTIVRPQTDPGAGEGATVVVQPLPPDVAAPPSRAPAPAAPAAAAKPLPAAPAKPVTAAPATTAPAAPATAAPATAAPATATKPTPGGGGHWAVQVGTFSVSANADQLAHRLSQSGRQAYVVDWQDRQGRTWKAVRVGNFAGEAAARGVAAQLKSEMNLSGQVIDLR